MCVLAIDPPDEKFLGQTHLNIAQRYSRAQLYHSSTLSKSNGEDQPVINLSPHAIYNAGWDAVLGKSPLWVQVKALQFGSVDTPDVAPTVQSCLHLDVPKTQLPVAAQICVSRISAASVVRVAPYRRALTSYFVAPQDQKRVLAIGHIFSIQVRHCFSPENRCEESLLEDQFDSEDLIMDEGSVQTVFYVVTDIKPTAKEPHQSAAFGQLFWIPPSVQIMQSSPVQTRLPPALRYPLPDSLESAAQRLVEMITPCFHPLAKKIGIRIPVLVHGPPSSGKRAVVDRAASQLGMHVFEVNCFELLQESGEVHTIQSLETIFEVSVDHTPCIILLRNLAALETNRANNGSGNPLDPQIARVLRELISKLSIGDDNLITVVATCDSKALDDASSTMRSCFTHTIAISTPDLHQRMVMIREILSASEVVCSLDVDLHHLALNTASFCLGDLSSLISRTLELMLIAQ